MNPTKSDHWRKFCDELIIASENDPELEDGLKWLDELAQKKGISFYEVLWRVVMMDRTDEDMGDFMQSITRRYKK